MEKTELRRLPEFPNIKNLSDLRTLSRTTQSGESTMAGRESRRRNCTVPMVL